MDFFVIKARLKVFQPYISLSFLLFSLIWQVILTSFQKVLAPNFNFLLKNKPARRAVYTGRRPCGRWLKATRSGPEPKAIGVGFSIFLQEN